MQNGLITCSADFVSSQIVEKIKTLQCSQYTVTQYSQNFSVLSLNYSEIFLNIEGTTSSVVGFVLLGGLSQPVSHFKSLLMS